MTRTTRPRHLKQLRQPGTGALLVATLAVLAALTGCGGPSVDYGRPTDGVFRCPSADDVALVTGSPWRRTEEGCDFRARDVPEGSLDGYYAALVTHPVEGYDSVADLRKEDDESGFEYRTAPQFGGDSYVEHSDTFDSGNVTVTTVAPDGKPMTVTVTDRGGLTDSPEHVAVQLTKLIIEQR